MDTVTHSLVGGAISDGFFRKRLGPLATPFSMIAGALPDIDAVAYLVSPEYAWAHHRGITHSFLAIFLAAPLLGFAGHRLSRREGAYSQWTLLALLCLLSHTLIDLSTSWGTMPLLPFSNARISWDIAPILDVFVFSVAGLSFLLNRALRRERVDHSLNPLEYPVVHSHPKRRKAADLIGRAAVFLMLFYFALGVQQNRQAVRMAREELAKAGIEAAEVRALPLMFTYIAYGIAARDAEGTVYNAVHSSYAPRPMAFRRHPTASGPLVSRAIATNAGRLFAWYSQGMFTASEERDESGTTVRLADRRFYGLSRPDDSRFVTEFRFGADGEFLSGGGRQMQFREISVREEFARLWNLTWRGEPSLDLSEK